MELQMYGMIWCGMHMYTYLDHDSFDKESTTVKVSTRLPLVDQGYKQYVESCMHIYIFVLLLGFYLDSFETSIIMIVIVGEQGGRSQGCQFGP